MIVTFTPNPSMDRTAMLHGSLTAGHVHRLSGMTVEPGGKGVNVAMAVHRAGRRVLAVVPGGRHDPLLAALRSVGLPVRHVDTHTLVRTNLTVTQPDGTTTKFNESGASLQSSHVQQLTDVLVSSSRGAHWVALCGSLPPGSPIDWYRHLIEELRPNGVNIAVDTSGEALVAMAEGIEDDPPTLLTPNATELAQLTGFDADELVEAATHSDTVRVREAARELNSRGVEYVMVTLGVGGAVLSTRGRAWHAIAPTVRVRSTVGAGDAALAGFLLAHSSGQTPDECLRTAVAYGSATVTLPGSGIPGPSQIDRSSVRIVSLDADTRRHKGAGG